MGEFETLEEYQNSIKEFKAKSISGFEDFIIKSNNDRAKLQLRCTPYTDKKCGCGCHDLDFGLSVWMNQQSKIEQLENRVLELENIMTYVVEELEYPTAPYDEVIRCSIKSLKGGLNEDQD